MKEPQKPISPPNGGNLTETGGFEQTQAKLIAANFALENIAFTDQTSRDKLEPKVLQIRLIIGRELRRIAKQVKAATGGQKK